MMNGMPHPMAAENPYAAETIAARQRIGRLKDRIAQRAAARRNLLSDKEATLGSMTDEPTVTLAPIKIVFTCGDQLIEYWAKFAPFQCSQSSCFLQEQEAITDEPMEEKSSNLPLQQMIARHLLDPNTTIPTDNAKLRAAVRLWLATFPEHPVLHQLSGGPYLKALQVFETLLKVIPRFADV
jgi:hypothetical protein